MREQWSNRRNKSSRLLFSWLSQLFCHWHATCACYLYIYIYSTLSLPILFIARVKANVEVSHRLDELWILKISRLPGKYIDRSMSNPSGSMLKRCLLRRGHAFPLTRGLIRSTFALPQLVPSSLTPSSSYFNAPLRFLFLERSRNLSNEAERFNFNLDELGKY